MPPPRAVPESIRPELPVPCASAFDAEEWRFSVDWDGMRAMFVIGPQGEVRLHDALLRDVGDRFPEIVESAGALGRRSAVIDGVVTVLDHDGRPDLPGLVDRAQGRGGRAAPAAFLATDLLHLDGSTTAAWPLDRRHGTLGILVPPHPRLQVPGWVAGHGRAFCDAASQQGLSAVLARRGAAPYRPGVASPDRLRIALQDRVDTVVVGMIRGGPVRRLQSRSRPVVGPSPVAALLLAEWVDGRLCDAGRAGAPASSPVADWLRARADELRVAEAPPGIGAAGEVVTWVRPGLVATVVHHGRDEDGRLRLPAVVAVRDDVDPAWCIRRPPVAPPDSTPLTGGFRPTVLRTLPFDAD